MTDMTREQIEALCEALPGVEYTLNCWEWPDHAETVRQALTAIRQLQRGWMGIESMELWDVGVVTDGDNVAKAQKAETDYGGFYFAIEPEDCLEWEPTAWMPLPPEPGQ